MPTLLGWGANGSIALRHRRSQRFLLRLRLIARHRRRARVVAVSAAAYGPSPVGSCLRPVCGPSIQSLRPHGARIGLANETRPRLRFTNRWSVCGVQINEHRRISCPGLEL